MNKIEQVARALEDELGKNGFFSFEDAARAAIEAMRVPTEGMVGACGTNYHQYEIYDNWQAMIDAALEGE